MAAKAKGSTTARAAAPANAEAELEKVKAELEQTRAELEAAKTADDESTSGTRDSDASTTGVTGRRRAPTPSASDPVDTSGIEALRQSDMMAHLLDALANGEDIGHYGKLVFAMVARHFLDEEQVVTYLQKAPDTSEEDARGIYRQVEGRDYNPPRRDRVLEWQSQQDFPICPTPDDPDSCNVYKDLQFPDEVYEHIQEYQEQKSSQ